MCLSKIPNNELVREIGKFIHNLSSTTIRYLFKTAMGDDERIDSLTKIFEGSLNDNIKLMILMEAMAQIDATTFTRLFELWSTVSIDDTNFAWLFKASFRHGENRKFTNTLLQKIARFSTLSEYWQVKVYEESVKQDFAQEQLLDRLSLKTLSDYWKHEIIAKNSKSTTELQAKLLRSIQLENISDHYRIKIIEGFSGVDTLFSLCYELMIHKPFSSHYAAKLYAVPEFARMVASTRVTPVERVAIQSNDGPISQPSARASVRNSAAQTFTLP